MPTNPAIQSINIRFPAPLLARVRERAAADHRSLHGELLWLLERALAAEDASLYGELRAYVARHPAASIMEIMGEFDLTDKEAMAALQAAGEETRR